MSGAPLRIICTGLPDNLSAVLPAVAVAAGQALELDRDFSGIRICGDCLPFEDGAWYRLEPGLLEGDKPLLALFCRETSFGPVRRTAAAGQPPRADWEQAPWPPAEPAAAATSFSRERAAIFLYHHLLTAQDLARGVVVGHNLPATLAEAFAEAWAVGVDGRLARLGLPGYSLAERRASFVRVFSPAGILLPDHWQVFQSLWDGAIEDQKGVLAVLKWLPGL